MDTQPLDIARLTSARVIGRKQPNPPAAIPPSRDCRAWPAAWPMPWEIDQLAADLGVPSPLDDLGAAEAIERARKAAEQQQARLPFTGSGGRQRRLGGPAF